MKSPRTFKNNYACGNRPKPDAVNFKYQGLWVRAGGVIIHNTFLFLYSCAVYDLHLDPVFIIVTKKTAFIPGFYFLLFTHSCSAEDPVIYKVAKG
jgi:hypothetical protein